MPIAETARPRKKKSWAAEESAQIIATERRLRKWRELGLSSSRKDRLMNAMYWQNEHNRLLFHLRTQQRQAERKRKVTI